jgi:hypothetical protein
MNQMSGMIAPLDFFATDSAPSAPWTEISHPARFSGYHAVRALKRKEVQACMHSRAQDHSYVLLTLSGA